MKSNIDHTMSLRINLNNFLIQFFKYGVVGGINFIFSLALYLFLLRVLHVRYLIAFSVTWFLGILLTYVINFLWVFKPDDKLEFKQRFPKYFLVYLTSYVANVIILRYLVEEYAFDPFYIQFAIIPLVVLINFFGFKYWSLK